MGKAQRRGVTRIETRVFSSRAKYPDNGDGNFDFLVLKNAISAIWCQVSLLCIPTRAGDRHIVHLGSFLCQSLL